MSTRQHSHNAIRRKATALALGVSRGLKHWAVDADQYRMAPPVLVNAFPKSGTHLLEQIASALPDRRNYGRFLASLHSSRRFRLRSDNNIRRFISSIVPGELIRGHLFFSDGVIQALFEANIVHYFIYRDLRDVAVSEAHYLRTINRWHRLHPYFRRLPSLSDAISLSIRGLGDSVSGLLYPNVGERFRSYSSLMGREDVFSVRFEDLMSPDRNAYLRKVIEFYQVRSEQVVDQDEILDLMQSSILPERSHTYRVGRVGTWQRAFNDGHREQFKEVAGQLLVDLGYEQDMDW